MPTSVLSICGYYLPVILSLSLSLSSTHTHEVEYNTKNLTMTLKKMSVFS